VKSAAARREVIADKEGKFSMRGMLPGSDTLNIMSIGYHRLMLPITVPSKGGLWLLVPLEPSVTYMVY
jgi:hypothetical protein